MMCKVVYSNTNIFEDIVAYLLSGFAARLKGLKTLVRHHSDIVISLALICLKDVSLFEGRKFVYYNVDHSKETTTLTVFLDNR